MHSSVSELGGTFLADPFSRGFKSLASTEYTPDVQEDEDLLRDHRHRFIPIEEIPDKEPTIEEKLAGVDATTSQASSTSMLTRDLDARLRQLFLMGPDQVITTIRACLQRKAANRRDPAANRVLVRMPSVLHGLVASGDYSLDKFKESKAGGVGGPTCYKALLELAKVSPGAAACLTLLKRGNQAS